MTITLHVSITHPDDAGRAIFRALMQAGREWDAARYTVATWAIGDVEEAIQAVLKLCADIIVVWEDSL